MCLTATKCWKQKCWRAARGMTWLCRQAHFLQRQIVRGRVPEAGCGKTAQPSANMWDVVTTNAPSNTIPTTPIRSTTCGAPRGIGVNVGKVQRTFRGGCAACIALELVFKAENMAKLAACGVHFLGRPDRNDPGGAAVSWAKTQTAMTRKFIATGRSDVFMAVRPAYQKIPQL